MSEKAYLPTHNTHIVNFNLAISLLMRNDYISALAHSTRFYNGCVKVSYASSFLSMLNMRLAYQNVSSNGRHYGTIFF